MTARAIDRTVLTSTTDLTDVQRAQLTVVGKLYFGEGELPRIAEDDSDGDPMETRTLLNCEVWRVVDDGRHLFDAWLYMGDSGTIFEAGTTDRHVHPRWRYGAPLGGGLQGMSGLSTKAGLVHDLGVSQRVTVGIRAGGGHEQPGLAGAEAPRELGPGVEDAARDGRVGVRLSPACGSLPRVRRTRSPPEHPARPLRARPRERALRSAGHTCAPAPRRPRRGELPPATHGDRLALDLAPAGGIASTALQSTLGMRGRSGLVMAIV